MQAREAMSSDPCFIRPATSLHEAAQLMRDNDVGCLPVGEDTGSIVGMLTDRDITVRAVAEGMDLMQTHAKEIMTQNVESCFEDTPLQDVARLMEAEKVRRVVVFNRDSHRMSGIISVSDIAVHCKDSKLVGVIESAVCGKAA